jgi:hypothetical protein
MEVTRPIYIYSQLSRRKKTPGGVPVLELQEPVMGRYLFLPGALLVTIRLQTLAALVLVHLETALFLEIAHGGKC